MNSSTPDHMKADPSGLRTHGSKSSKAVPLITTADKNLQKSWRFLSRDILKKNGGKASRENQDSGQNTYLKTCKLFARDIDSYVVR